jgi:hypothetical protein
MLLRVVIVMSLLIFANSVDGLSVYKVNITKELEDSEKPRTIDKALSLMFDLYKVYNSLKVIKKPSSLKKSAKVKNEIIPFDGLFFGDYFNRKVDTIERFPTLVDINKQEMIMMDDEMKDKDAKKKEDPHYALIKKYLKDMNVVLIIKLMLKFIIFKGIVKFIALVCLLFFVPTLNYPAASTDSSEETRSLDAYGKGIANPRVKVNK